jgi:hypothetical protein
MTKNDLSAKPVPELCVTDKSRFQGVTAFGVDKHFRHHVPTKLVKESGRRPKKLTRMDDLSRDAPARVRVGRLDLAPGWSVTAVADWSQQR